VGRFLEFIGSSGEVIEKKWRAGVELVGCCMDQELNRESVFFVQRNVC